MRSRFLLRYYPVLDTHLLVLQVGQVTGRLVDPSAHPHSTARGVGGGLLDSLVAGEESGPGGRSSAAFCVCKVQFCTATRLGSDTWPVGCAGKFSSLVAGPAAVCRCKVLLSGCCLRLGALLVPLQGPGVAAGCHQQSVAAWCCCQNGVCTLEFGCWCCCGVLLHGATTTARFFHWFEQIPTLGLSVGKSRLLMSWLPKPPLIPERSLFGRLIDRFGDVAALLSIQYRSNEVIMGWSSRSFYDSKLLAASSVAHQTLKLQAANITSEVVEILMAPMLFVACST